MQETKETRVGSLGWEDPLEKGMATHSSTLAWRIPRTEEPGGSQPTGSERVRHDSNSTTVGDFCRLKSSVSEKGLPEALPLLLPLGTRVNFIMQSNPWKTKRGAEL